VKSDRSFRYIEGRCLGQGLIVVLTYENLYQIG